MAYRYLTMMIVSMYLYILFDFRVSTVSVVFISKLSVYSYFDMQTRVIKENTYTFHSVLMFLPLTFENTSVETGRDGTDMREMCLQI